MSKLSNEMAEAVARKTIEDDMKSIPDGQTLLQLANENFKNGNKPKIPSKSINNNRVIGGKFLEIKRAYDYFHKGYTYCNKVLKYEEENKEPIIFDYWTQTIFAIDENVLDYLEKMTKDFELSQQSLDLEQAKNTSEKHFLYDAFTAARDLENGIDFKVYNRTELFDQLVTYNNKFYARLKGTQDMIPILSEDVADTLYDLYYVGPKDSIETKIAQLIKRIQERNHLKHIPDYVFRPGKPKDNGFRFNKAAYRLIHYYLREVTNDNKDAYIMTIMSEGGQGKSTFSNFLKCLFKNEYYSADSKYTNQFSTSFFAPYRLTIFNDCSSDYLVNTHIFKQISGGDEIQIEAKGKQAYSGNIDARLLFIGNEDLRYNILDSGLLRRFVNMPWDNTVIKEHYTPEFGYEEVEPTKDNKWVNYKWTDDEIAFQVELADKLYEYDLKDKLDLDNICDRTVAKVFLSHPAIRSDVYSGFVEYCKNEGIRVPWSEDKYKLYQRQLTNYINKGIITLEEVIEARELEEVSLAKVLGLEAMKPIPKYVE